MAEQWGDQKKYFNPRSPCGERRIARTAMSISVVISIHAPRAGSDIKGPQGAKGDTDFNPRSPCGERRKRR